MLRSKSMAAPLALSLFVFIIDSTVADADDAVGANGAAGTSSAPGASLSEVVITAERLNAERAEIETQTGASTYTIDDAAIAAMPGGSNVQLNQVLLQAPDVAQDSFGQLHIRGDRNDTRNTASTASSCPKASASSARRSIQGSSHR